MRERLVEGLLTSQERRSHLQHDWTGESRQLSSPEHHELLAGGVYLGLSTSAGQNQQTLSLCVVIIGTITSVLGRYMPEIGVPLPPRSLQCGYGERA